MGGWASRYAGLGVRQAQDWAIRLNPRTLPEAARSTKGRLEPLQ